MTYMRLPNPEDLMFTETPFTLFILLITVLVSGYALYFDRSLIDKLSFKPDRIRGNGEYYRLLTAGFIHAGPGHLAFNMMTLFFFGPSLERMLGSGSFLLVYFVSELVAHGFTLWWQRKATSYAAVGASGAISGVLLSFCLFRPFDRIGLFFAIWMPAWLFAVGFLVFSVVAMRKRDPKASGGIAHEAHLGGAIGGLLATLLLEPSALSIFLRQIGL